MSQFEEVGNVHDTPDRADPGGSGPTGPKSGHPQSEQCKGQSSSGTSHRRESAARRGDGATSRVSSACASGEAELGNRVSGRLPRSIPQELSRGVRPGVTTDAFCRRAHIGRTRPVCDISCAASYYYFVRSQSMPGFCRTRILSRWRRSTRATHRAGVRGGGPGAGKAPPARTLSLPRRLRIRGDVGGLGMAVRLRQLRLGSPGRSSLAFRASEGWRWESNPQGRHRAFAAA
jgi:hypothetical protein